MDESALRGGRKWEGLLINMGEWKDGSRVEYHEREGWGRACIGYHGGGYWRFTRGSQRAAG